MRIVAGLAKGRRLAAPVGATRPTSDRAREALFNALATLLDLHDAVVLDLFAGTGAVGFEALSRGAARAVLVESDRRACEVLRRNASELRLPGAVIRARTVDSYLRGGPTDGPFDLVFADPPYALSEDDLARMLEMVAGNGWLDPDAVVVVERSARGEEPRWPEGITPLRSRRYGEGVLWYGRRR